MFEFIKAYCDSKSHPYNIFDIHEKVKSISLLLEIEGLTLKLSFKIYPEVDKAVLYLQAPDKTPKSKRKEILKLLNYINSIQAGANLYMDENRFITQRSHELFGDEVTYTSLDYLLHSCVGVFEEFFGYIYTLMVNKNRTARTQIQKIEGNLQYELIPLSELKPVTVDNRVYH